MLTTYTYTHILRRYSMAKKTETEKETGFWESVWGGIKSAGSWIGEQVSDGYDWVADQFSSDEEEKKSAKAQNANEEKGFFGRLWDNICDGAQAAWDFVKSPFVSDEKEAGNTTKPENSGEKKGFFGRLWDNICDGAQAAWDFVKSPFVSDEKEAGNTTKPENSGEKKGFFGRLWDNICDGAQAAWDFVKSPFVSDEKEAGTKQASTQKEEGTTEKGKETRDSDNAKTNTQQKTSTKPRAQQKSTQKASQKPSNKKETPTAPKTSIFNAEAALAAAPGIESGELAIEIPDLELTDIPDITPDIQAPVVPVVSIDIAPPILPSMQEQIDETNRAIAILGNHERG